MKTVGVIRDRGQLTIPDSVRKVVTWLTPSSAVDVIVEKPDEIKIRPHNAGKSIDFNGIWKEINKSRSIKGKGKMSASEFLAKDRSSH